MINYDTVSGGECACIPCHKPHTSIRAHHQLRDHVPWREVLLLPQPGAVGHRHHQGEAQGGGAARTSCQQWEGERISEQCYSCYHYNYD